MRSKLLPTASQRSSGAERAAAVEMDVLGIAVVDAVDRRTGQDRQKRPQKFSDIAIVECNKCDAEYVISHKRKVKGSPAIAGAQGDSIENNSD